MKTIKLITDSLLDATSDKAKQSTRLRMNFDLHDSTDEPVNRLLNAMEPGTYVRPHRHLSPEKAESCIVLRGSLDILIFDDEGRLIQRETVSPRNGLYGFDIPPGIWHGLVVNVPDTVVYEVKTGPYTPVAESDLAPWSPDVKDREGVAAFLNKYFEGQEL